jgi:uncharacterized membrane protein YdcZ (DUF606 family)
LTIDHLALLGAAMRPASPARLIGAGVMLLGVLIAMFGDLLMKATAR